MEISSKDWSLYKEKIGSWQEEYMEKLCKEYEEILNSDKLSSEKFWLLEKRIKEDKKHPGVQVELSKRDMLLDLVNLLKDGAITSDDLSEFSDDLKKIIAFLIEK